MNKEKCVDRYLLPAGPTAANLQQRVCCCGWAHGATAQPLVYFLVQFVVWANNSVQVGALFRDTAAQVCSNAS